MRLTVLGRSPATPNPGEACAGYLVEGGGARVLIDCGSGVIAQLLRVRRARELGAVIISHMHPDHMLDLVTLRVTWWLEAPRRGDRLRVILPPGAGDQILDLAKGAGERRYFDKSFDIAEHDGAGALEFASLRLEPVRVQHYIPTWGFRITAAGSGEDHRRRLAYSADSGPCDALADLADGADLFLCEAALRSLDDEAPPPAPRGHLLASEAGAAARDAGARRLLLTHLPTAEGATSATDDAASAFGGPTEVAQPLGSYRI
ncbi:MAG TPA: MBL fold metallo-hydrolase [Candidatus Limnocylindria bacterium]|nr:MBL fold metallo-hydrolase [Candidatus Limnocylindria bacterium]